MKLKEYPSSLFNACLLQPLSPVRLNSIEGMPLPVIVSLTSIPSRLATVHLTIRSLLAQTHKPEKVVLWLNDRLRGQIPDSLARLEGGVFQIRFAGLDCSHRKLVHARAAFPGRLIVTCDDDLMYGKSWLVRLYRDHLRHPQSVIAHECRSIALDGGALLPYKQWPVETRQGVSDQRLLPIGYGGVLYPPGGLHEDVDNPELFLKLAPRADDLWFKAMSYLAGTTTRRSSDPGSKPIPIVRSQRDSLQKSNVKQDANRVQWQSICEYYNFAIE
ncbi:glycosyltransferase family A protein [Marinimicrobium sp. ABcell2]|uniref:glycosyltransferase family A protein n=1 Tax=Marinimicrobium sp. ABcell2 TaxID=3069751 RepID=UPI0027B3EC07|nr:glycosyltransferase family A protein [Marinimicrobium sp. ABcell2]MDQ2077153.1 glycosyltransferase family A protein [Marinimicrobium sp. ABcell2]